MAAAIFGVAATFVAATFVPALHGQAAERPIDRWLFADAQALIPGADPLEADGTPALSGPRLRRGARILAARA